MIIAHRGFADNCRENTLEAYLKAIEVGADAIELDVRRTKDNIFILFHDEFISEKVINQLTYKDLNSLVFNLGFQVPTLREVLELVQEKIKLDVELKEEGYETDIITLICKYLTLEQFIVTSFKIQSLSRIKLDYPQVKTGLVLDQKTAKKFDSNASLIYLDFLVLEVSLFDNPWLEIAQTNSKNILLWTVNEEKIIENLLRDERIEGIITDKSDLAVQLKNKINNRNR